jgi:hypothetical protein
VNDAQVISKKDCFVISLLGGDVFSRGGDEVDGGGGQTSQVYISRIAKVLSWPMTDSIQSARFFSFMEEIRMFYSQNVKGSGRME